MISDEYTSDFLNARSKKDSLSLSEPRPGTPMVPRTVTRISRSKYRDANWMP